MAKTTIEVKGKGHFEVEFTDGMNGISIYEKTLAEVIALLAQVNRDVKAISWVED